MFGFCLSCHIWAFFSAWLHASDSWNCRALETLVTLILRATLAWMIRQHGDMFLLHTDYSIWFSFVHIISFSMQAAGQQVGQVFPQAGAFYMQPLTQVMRLGIMQVNNRLSCLDIVEMVIWRRAWNKDLSDVS